MPTSSQDYADLEIRIQPLRQDGYPVTLVVSRSQEHSGFLDSPIKSSTPSASPGGRPAAL